MALTHKDKLDITKHIIYPTLELYGVKQEFKKDVAKLIKENLIINGKWENIRVDDKFDKIQFKDAVRTTTEIIKENNPFYFYSKEYEMIPLF